MKIIENITNGYRKIASGIAIVAFLALMYFALIPGGTMALSSVTAVSGDPIIGAFVKLVDYPQYNATTVDPDGTYLITDVPYDAIAGGSTYKLRVSAAGYGSNSTYVTLTSAAPNPAANFDLYPSVPKYMPYLDDRGTTYESDIQIFNPYDFNTTEDLTTYNKLNGIKNTSVFEVPVNSLGSKYAEQVAGGDFVGSVVVENTRPQSLVQGVIRTLSTGIYSIAPSRKIPAETVQYLPYLDDRGTTYDSGIQIFNSYDVPITVNLTAYNKLNGLTTTLPSFSIPAKTFDSRYAGDVAGGAVGSNVDFVGTVKVETSQPSPAQGNVRTKSTLTNSIATALGIPATTVQYLPYLDDRGTTYDSGVQIFNPYDVPVTVNVTAYNKLNGLTTSLPSFSIPAKSFDSRYAGDIAGGAVGSNVDFVGTVKVETSQPSPVQGSIRTLSTMQSSLAPAVIIPVETVQYVLFLNDTGTTYDSGVQIFNPYDVPISVTLTAYNKLNGLTSSLPAFSIPAKSFDSRYAGDIAGGSVGSNVDFVGTVKVETSQPAAVQGNIRAKLASNTNTVEVAVVLG